MPLSDIQLVFQWWSALFLVGVAAYPLTKKLFISWWDRGYLFSKAVGMAVVTYLVFLFGTIHILPFTIISVIAALCVVFLGGIIFRKTQRVRGSDNQKIRNFQFSGMLNFRPSGFPSFPSFPSLPSFLNSSATIVLEELFFFLALLVWSWVKAHEPSIRGLEKFMDFGFMQSLLNSQYFPASDMWWAGGTINYYFFGHLVTAVLTRLSGLDLAVTFNLMLATIFALTLTMSFSIGYQLMELVRKNKNIPENSENSEDQRIRGSDNQRTKNFRFSVFLNFRPSDYLRFLSILNIPSLLNGLLTAFLVTLAGNMQTLYAFTKGYLGDNVVPFWTVLWSIQDIGGIGGLWDGTLMGKLGEGMNRYWYANATRFIPFTIHEFPSYSFVVSDVHGHVLSIPFVLLAIGLLIIMINSLKPENVKTQMSNVKSMVQILNSKVLHLVFYGFLLGILLMTNALDGPIYLGLLGAILIMHNAQCIMSNKNNIIELVLSLGVVCLTLFLTALPFLIHFKSFASGIGINCPPEFLANTKIGSFLFEGVEKCQKSPLWMMELLWGFFWFTGAWLFIRRMWGKEQYDSTINRILKVFYLFSIFLIIVPEFFYVKDIYPAHFRSNTMFKLGYEAFILWSIIAAYVIVHFVFQRLMQKSKVKSQNDNAKVKMARIFFFVLLFPQLFLVSIYPIFSIRSYFGELKTYRSIDGLDWLRKEYADDYEAIQWLKQAVSLQSSDVRQSEDGKLKANSSLPVIVEADGESYTDYNHISAFAGVPTIVGWGVHEWLWRGGYDEVGPRREEVRKIYTSTDVDEVRGIVDAYGVRYIIVGKLEREKYPDMDEERIASFGTLVFQSGETSVYEVGFK